ncbi:ATP-dependent endonuclease [Arthrobacter sp. 2MCAF15]|uniref:ATP-dependent nuclease n=1 Tax=Arthrobacter sp. 2MCAF15 TaxID=3232984 RepID=UPI003F919C62
MRVRRLWISNFRGVRELDWKLPTDQQLVALVGPGDSGKSTILDALHYLLGDRWNIPFADTDFFGVNVENPIVVKALLTDLPMALKKEAALGLWLSGVDDQGEAHQDPEDGLEPALLVQLVVSADLEPRWFVVRSEGELQSLSSSQRRAFSTFKVDDRADAQLRWSRNSPLGRMSAEGGGEREALAAASRAARDALGGHQSTSLTDIAAKVQDRANKIGSGSFSDIKPGLDTSRSSMSAGLALYEDVIPLTSYGLGSRRLASLAVQQLAAGSRSVAVVDELESGLEPHRAVRLLNYLVSDKDYSQVIVTTHSPVIVEQARIENLATVQNRNGVVTVTSLGNSGDLIQRLRRTRPSSLLARRVVVAEGKTEHGLLLELIDVWDAERAASGQSTSAGEGVAIQDGNGGTEVGPRSEALAQLGFSVMAFLDNDDRSVDAGIAAAASSGVQIVRWNHGLNTETQVCSGLQAPALTAFITLGIQRRSSEDTVRQDLNSIDPVNPVLSLDVEDWLNAGVTLEAARNRIAQAAIKRKWFKDVDGGRALGAWIVWNYSQAQLSSTTCLLDEVRAFLYPGEDANRAAGGVSAGEPPHG